MLKKIKAKVIFTRISLMAKIRNEEGSLQTFVTVIGLAFVAAMLIWSAYEILNAFFPGFLNDFLNSIKAKFTIS